MRTASRWRGWHEQLRLVLRGPDKGNNGLGSPIPGLLVAGCRACGVGEEGEVAVGWAAKGFALLCSYMSSEGLPSEMGGEGGELSRHSEGLNSISRGMQEGGGISVLCCTDAWGS